MCSQIVLWLMPAIFLMITSRAQAQQPVKIPRIGFLSGASPSTNIADKGTIIKNIRYQSKPDHTRVVIDVSNKGRFVADKASDPARIFIDFYHAAPAKKLTRMMEVGNDFLKSIRTGQYEPDRVRVVLDLTNRMYEEKIVFVKDPPRVVVDLFSVKKQKKPYSPAEGREIGSAPQEQKAETIVAAALPEKNDEQTLSLEAGVRAETEGRWEKAVGIYKLMLEKTPDRTDLWIRISDIEARLGNGRDD